MKHIIIASLLLVCVNLSQSQIKCEGIPMKTEAEIRESEECVLHAADYLLQYPPTMREFQNMIYQRMILEWVSVTPDYTFHINDRMTSIGKQKEGLFSIYIGTLVKAAIENEATDTVKALKIFAKYLADPRHKIKQSKIVKTFLTDVEAGNFQPYK